jgi:hypothetical protein
MYPLLDQAGSLKNGSGSSCDFGRQTGTHLFPRVATLHQLGGVEPWVLTPLAGLQLVSTGCTGSNHNHGEMQAVDAAGFALVTASIAHSARSPIATPAQWA